MREAAETSVAALANKIKDKILNRASAQGDSGRTFKDTRVTFRGPYTIVILDNEFTGIAKFNPNDYKYQEETGLKLATYRAVRHYLGLE